MFKVDDNNIRMIRGDSGVFNISITDINGRNVELTDSDVLTFTLRRTARNSTIVLQKVIVNGELDIKPADTEGLAFGAYIYMTLSFAVLMATLIQLFRHMSSS